METEMYFKKHAPFRATESTDDKIKKKDSQLKF